jgi:hypothetical protein
MIDLDHVGLVARDRFALHAAYERLGFRLTPLSQQSGGDPPRLLGSANRCVFLPDGGYIELLGIVDPALPLNRLDEFLARYEGMHVLALGTDDAAREAARLGVPTVGLSREVEGDKVAFRLARLASFPEGRVQLVQHLSREILWAPRWTEHPNGALALEDAVLHVADRDEATARFAKILGCQPMRQDGASVFRLARGTVSIVEMGEAPLLPFFGAFTVSVRDEATLRRVLDAGRVSYRRESRALVVSRQEAGGIACRFLPIA